MSAGSLDRPRKSFRDGGKARNRKALGRIPAMGDRRAEPRPDARAYEASHARLVLPLVRAAARGCSRRDAAPHRDCRSRTGALYVVPREPIRRKHGFGRCAGAARHTQLDPVARRLLGRLDARLEPEQSAVWRLARHNEAFERSAHTDSHGMGEQPERRPHADVGDNRQRLEPDRCPTAINCCTDDLRNTDRRTGPQRSSRHMVGNDSDQRHLPMDALRLLRWQLRSGLRDR